MGKKVVKQIKQVVDIEHVTAVDFGTFSKLKASVLEVASKVKLSGKVPGGAAIKIGGADFSISAVHS